MASGEPADDGIVRLAVRRPRRRGRRTASVDLAGFEG